MLEWGTYHVHWMLLHLAQTRLQGVRSMGNNKGRKKSYPFLKKLLGYKRNLTDWDSDNWADSINRYSYIGKQLSVGQ